MALPRMYICNNREPDGINIRESHSKIVLDEFNNAYYCRHCKALNLKKPKVPGLDKHIYTIIRNADSSAFQLAGGFTRNLTESTCCQGGTGYLGSVVFDDELGMLRFLKRYFTVLPCETCFCESVTEKKKELESI
jgi:hypothetical protein